MHKEQALAAPPAHKNETFTEALEDVHDLLTRFHLQFGYRVIAEVSAFSGTRCRRSPATPV